jgi:hypothetical protein
LGIFKFTTVVLQLLDIMVSSSGSLSERKPWGHITITALGSSVNVLTDPNPLSEHDHTSGVHKRLGLVRNRRVIKVDIGKGICSVVYVRFKGLVKRRLLGFRVCVRDRGSEERTDYFLTLAEIISHEVKYDGCKAVELAIDDREGILKAS